MHLRPDEFIDIVEGARAEASAPHLADCEACRSHLSILRAAMSETAGVPVPEPSPLFWNHLSDRVRAAVAAEPPARSWWDAWMRPRALVRLSAATVAAVLVAIALNLTVLAPSPPRRAPSLASQAPAAGSADPDRDVLSDAASGVHDPSLTLVAALTADMDWDTAHAAGLATRGSAEHAVTHLTDGELRELERLLQEELVHRGA